MTNMTLDLSVIIPCHNEAITLPAQLDALVAEEWDGTWEIIVVDNRSTDTTADIARRYSGDAVSVRVVAAAERAGIAYARNSGVRESTARSIAFCDGDDVVCPGWVAAIGNALKTETLLTGTLDVHQLNEPWLAKTRPMGSSQDLPYFGGIAFARGNNTAMQRSLWDTVDGYREDFDGLEDIDFSVRAAGAGHEPVLITDARVAYRFRRGLRATWRQGIYYGRGRPEMAANAEALGLDGPGRFDGLRSWGWLAIKSPLLVTRAGRHAWVFTLAVRWGVVLGAVKTRRIFF
jgi:glycosyltransferase involved in cell wall biosynthesis